MKKQLLMVAALGLVSAASVQAQGYFNFSNYAPGVNAPISFGGTPVGNTFLADAWWGPANTSTDSSLQSLNLAIPFAASGYFLGGSQSIPGQTGAVTLQVRAWRGSDGSSYAAALANPNGVTGKGNLLQLGLAQPPTPAPNLVGLQSFSVAPIPEPSTFALIGLGIGALLFFRRRN